MPFQLHHKALCFSTVVTLGSLVTGCSDLEDKTPTSVSTEGTSLIAHIDAPKDGPTMQVAASVYRHGVIRPLVGGDLFYVTHADRSITLKAPDDLAGFYMGNLPAEDIERPLNIDIRFDPHVAREDRWYDSQALAVDTQASVLVGASGSATLPPEIFLTEPATDTLYRSRTDQIIMSWQTETPVLPMRLVTLQRCYQGPLSKTWTDTYRLSDTGSFTVNIADLIPTQKDINRVDPVAEAFTNIFLTFFEILTFGIVDVRTDNNKTFSIDYCTIDLRLHREQSGTLGDRVKGGQITASTSDSVTVRYEP